MYTEENSDLFPEMKSWFEITFGDLCPKIDNIVFVHLTYREYDKYEYYAQMLKVFESIDKGFENSAIVVKCPSSQKLEREEYKLLNSFNASSAHQSMLLYMSESFKKAIDRLIPVNERYPW